MKFNLEPRLRPGFFMLASALLTGLAYLPGLSGGFYFDDFAHIVFNPFVHPEHLDAHSLLAIANSSNSGPSGRPLAMVSFALNYAVHGPDPYWMKASNVGIHLSNGLLIYYLLSRLLPYLFSEQSKISVRGWAALATALWWTNPLQISSVLYIVQRMTLLSATFMLLGLVGYVHWRLREQPRLILAFLSLVTGTTLGILTKENALLTLVYAAVIEYFAGHFEAPRLGQRRVLKWIFLGGPIVLVAGLLSYWALHPDWFIRNYASRNFDIAQRLFTQARALGFYQWLILCPNLFAMGLYHDDYPTSLGLFDPPSTAFALIWHGLMFLLIWQSRKRAPLIAFGLAWFYGSHLLESTFWPLEMVFEHRNYLAILGLVLVLIGLFDALQRHSIKIRAKSWLGYGIFSGLAVLWLGLSSLRASDWGDFFSHALMEAQRHPQSARSQFEAGQTLGRGILKSPSMATEYYPLAKQYFEASQVLDTQSLASLVSLITLQAQIQGRIDDQTISELLKRLREIKPNAATSFNMHYLMVQILNENDTGPLLAPKAEEIFTAALANPNFKYLERAEVLVTNALYLGGQGHPAQESLPLLKEAVRLVPQKLDYRTMLAAKQIDAGEREDARITLMEIERMDRFYQAREEITHLREKLEIKE